MSQLEPRDCVVEHTNTRGIWELSKVNSNYARAPVLVEVPRYDSIITDMTCGLALRARTHQHNLERELSEGTSSLPRCEIRYKSSP